MLQSNVKQHPVIQESQGTSDAPSHLDSARGFVPPEKKNATKVCFLLSRLMMLQIDAGSWQVYVLVNIDILVRKGNKSVYKCEDSFM